MPHGRIYLVTDSSDTAADVAAALGVVGIPYAVFSWHESKELLAKCLEAHPAFILCDMKIEGDLQSRNDALLALGECRTGALSNIPLIALGQISQSDTVQSELFAGNISLPLQFPGSAQLLQRMVTECLIKSGAVFD